MEDGSVFLLTNYLNTLRLLLHGNGSGSVLQRILTATPTAHTPHTHTHMHTLLYRHTLALRRQLSSSIIKSELFTLYGIISACVRQCMCERECVCVSECVYTCMCVNVCL